MILPTQPIPEEKPVDIIVAEKNVPIEWNIGDIILDTYEVRDIFTSGGMGNVYRVHHRGWNMDLAVKSPKQEALNDRNVQNFIRECETWVSLGLHPHIVSCYYVRNLGGIPRIFAEFVDGGSLRDWIDQGKLYEVGQQEALKRILDIAIQTAWGLQYAHEQGLIHQDVKPANILMTPEGIAKVTDFGLAKARSVIGEVTTPGKNQTLMASFGGMTPAYCSPEQAAKRTLTLRTDVWSWAVTVLEMFTGEAFWLGGQFAGQALEEYQRSRSTRSELPVIPEEIFNFLRECLTIDLNKRPATVMEVADRLTSCYPAITGQRYARQYPTTLQMMADSLNNKAVSFIDIGLYHEAKITFDDLLKTNPNHLEGLYNRSLLEWRTGQITDEQVVREFEAFASTFPNDWRVKLYLGYLHIERGDRQSALDILREINRGATNDTRFMEALENAAKLTDRQERQLPNTEGSTIFELLPEHWFCFSGWKDNSLRIIDLESGEHTKVFQGFKGLGVQSIVILPDGFTAFSTGEDGRIRQWDMKKGRCTRLLEDHTGPVTALVVLKNQILISGGDDKTIRYWDIQTGMCIQNIPLKDFSQIFSLAVSSQGDYLFVGGTKVVVLDAKTGEIVREFAWEIPYGDFNNLVLSVAFCSQRNIALVGTYQNGAFILDLTGGSRRFLKGSDEGLILPDQIMSVGISTSGKYGLIVNAQGLTSLWDLELGIKLYKFPNWHTTEVAFSPDEKFAAIGAYIFPLEPFLSEIKSYSNRPFQELPSRDYFRKFHRRKASVREVCFSPVSRAVAVGDNEGYIELWQLGEMNGTGSLIFEVDSRQGLDQSEETGFDGHGGKINDVAITHDGKWAFTASEDKTARLWNLEQGKCVRVISHTAGVTSVAISDDGNFGLSGGNYENPCIYLWNLRSGEQLQVFKGHKGTISALTYLNTSNSFLSGCSDGSLRIWDANTGLCSDVLIGHTKGIKAVAISEDKSFAVSGGDDNKLVGWNIPSRKPLFTFEQHGFNISHLALCMKQGICIMADNDRIIRVVKLDSGKCLRTFSLDAFSGIQGIAIRDHQSVVVSTSSAGFKDIPLSQYEAMPYLVIRPQSSFDAAANQTKYRELISLAQQALYSNQVSRAAEYITEANNISGYEDSAEWIREWDRVCDKGVRLNLEKIVLLKSLPVLKPRRVIFSSDDRFVFIPAQIWDLKRFEVIRGYKNRTPEGIYLSHDVFSLYPDFKKGLFAGMDPKRKWENSLLVMVDMQNWKTIRILEGHTDSIKGISISPDGTYALSGSKDNQIRLWNLETGKCLKVMAGHQETIESLVFSPEGQFGISASRYLYEGGIMIWNLETGKLHREIKISPLPGYVDEYLSYVNGLAISENGKHLIALISNRVLYIFDCKTTKQIAAITGNNIVSTLEQFGVKSNDLFAGSTLNLIMPIYRPGLQGYISPSGKRAIITSDNASQQLVALKWNCEFPTISNWDQGALPYLESFLKVHPPFHQGLVFKKTRYNWNEQDFKGLLQKLAYYGYGWLRPEGVQHQLEKMAREWKRPQSLLG